MGGDSVRASTWMAVLAVGLGVIGCQVIVAERADRASSRIREANACIERGSYAEAIGLLEEALCRHPADLELHAAIAEAQEGLGRRSEALTHYEFCARQDPDSAHALWALATAYVRAGRHQQAIRALEKYARLHGLEKPCLRLLCYCYCKVGAAGRARQLRSQADLLMDGEKGAPAQPDEGQEILQYM